MIASSGFFSRLCRLLRCNKGARRWQQRSGNSKRLRKKKGGHPARPVCQASSACGGYDIGRVEAGYQCSLML